MDKTPSTSVIPLGVNSLSKIEIAIGNPLVTGECTQNKISLLCKNVGWSWYHPRISIRDHHQGQWREEDEIGSGVQMEVVVL